MKKTYAMLLAIFLFLYYLNTITPMFMGDDYVYSFVWEGHSLYQPLTENAKRISSWKELFSSQWLHYFTWSGRTVNHTIAQISLWIGKNVFNFFNALAACLLMIEIYYCSHKGIVTKKIHAGFLYWIFFSVWAFTPGFGNVFFWLDGACNYLWPSVIVFGFLIPFIRKYYFFAEHKSNGRTFSLCMFFFGLAAGWTNENTGCCLIPVLALFFYTHRNEKSIENWMCWGLAGLIIGYALLMFAPGNVVRLYAEKKGSNWLTLEAVMNRSSRLMFILCYFQLFLWYFNLRALFSLRGKIKNQEQDVELTKEVFLAKIFCVLAFSMSFVLLFSPSFQFRSGLSGTGCLVIAHGILLRIQTEYGICLIPKRTRMFLVCVSLLYFSMTTFVSVNNYWATYLFHENVITAARNMRNKDEVLEVELPQKPGLAEQIMSGYHLAIWEVSEDENEWKNVSFARYYGIKGVRSVKGEQ